jgi:hypothetical protein
MPKVPSHVVLQLPVLLWTFTGSWRTDMSFLQQPELPPDVSVLQQPMIFGRILHNCFRSIAVVGQTPPGTVHAAVEQRHQTCLGTAQTHSGAAQTHSGAAQAQAAVGQIHLEVAQSVADRHMQWKHRLLLKRHVRGSQAPIGQTRPEAAQGCHIHSTETFKIYRQQSHL